MWAFVSKLVLLTEKLFGLGKDYLHSKRKDQNFDNIYTMITAAEQRRPKHGGRRPCIPLSPDLRPERT